MKQKMSRASGVDCAAAAFANGRGLSWSKNFLKKVVDRNRYFVLVYESQQIEGVTTSKIK